MDFCIEIEVQDIIANEKREFFKKFYPELLTSNKANKQLIEEFVATEEGKELEKFLKDNRDFSLRYEHTYMPHKDKTDGFYCALLVKD